MKDKFIIFSPVVWIVYFGLLFSVYFNLLNIGGIDESYFTEIYKTKEFMWRIVWGLFSISSVLISTVSILCSFNAIYSNATHHLPRYKNFIFVVILLFLSLISVLFMNTGIGGGAVSEFLTMAEEKINIEIVKIVDITMVLAASAVFLIAVSSSTILAKSGKTTVEELRRKYAYFRVSFYVTSIFLGIGVAQVYLLFIWASHSVGVDNAAVQMAYALTVSGSIIYTLVFIILFIPVSIVLKYRVRNVAKESIDIDDGEKFVEWKKSSGLFNTPSKNIGDIAILLSPVILGALANILSGIVT